MRLGILVLGVAALAVVTVVLGHQGPPDHVGAAVRGDPTSEVEALGPTAASPTPAASQSSMSPMTLQSGSASPSPSPISSIRPLPTTLRGPVDINLAPNGKAVFSSQLTKEWCAPAGLTSALATMHLVRASNTVQRQLESRIEGWTTYPDSHNGGWGPLAMTKALAAYGAPGYVVRTFGTRAAALRAAGIALSATHEPVLLLAWWGAHTWVMTGYRATGDLTDPKASFTGAYVVDPWYPRVSSIWGHVNPPGHFYDMAGMRRNYIAWTRPEGRYPGRDGRWVAVIPTRTLSSGRS
jgi:hypothetical protein